MNRLLPELCMDNGEERGTQDPHFLPFVCFYCSFFLLFKESRKKLRYLIGSWLGRVTYLALTACFIVL